MKRNDAKLKEYCQILEGLRLLDVLLTEEKKALADALVEMHFKQGETVVKQGETGDIFYILYEGKVEIVKDGTKVADLEAVSKTRTVQFFGEQALLKNDQRNATVTISSPE